MYTIAIVVDILILVILCRVKYILLCLFKNDITNNGNIINDKKHEWNPKFVRLYVESILRILTRKSANKIYKNILFIIRIINDKERFNYTSLFSKTWPTY